MIAYPVPHVITDNYYYNIVHYIHQVVLFEISFSAILRFRRFE